MPRRPRVFVEGGLYHVYNRASHGLAIFNEVESGWEFAEILGRELRGDGYTVYAWVVMGNHYHLVVRSSAVQLARVVGRIQSTFGRVRNRRRGSRGPTWQGRYRAKLVSDEGYLLQLIAYVHLNPVAAGMVADPAEHELSGHREVLGLSHPGVVDRLQVLSMYGATESEGERNYLSALTALQDGDAQWKTARPGGLPWWGREVDRPLEFQHPVAWVDGDGRPSREARPCLEAREYLAAACAELAIDLSELTLPSRVRELAHLRFLVVGLGIERWSQQAGDLARIFSRRPDFVSWWARRGRQLRLEDQTWAARYEDLDERIRARYEEPREDRVSQ